MTFKGTASEDISRILAAFPRRFTIKEVEEYFQWPTKRVKQAIVMGQSNDAVAVLLQAHNKLGVPGEATYENLTWRREWLTRAWRPHESVMDGKEQGYG